MKKHYNVEISVNLAETYEIEAEDEQEAENEALFRFMKERGNSNLSHYAWVEVTEADEEENDA